MDSEVIIGTDAATDESLAIAAAALICSAPANVYIWGARAYDHGSVDLNIATKLQLSPAAS